MPLHLGRYLRNLIITIATSLVLAGGTALLPGGTSSAQQQAYLAVATFAPWNLVASYTQILFIPDDTTAEFPSLQPFDPLHQHASTAKTTDSYSLTRGANYFLRPITAVIDLLLHMLADFGLVGFIVTVAQLSIGAGLMYLLNRGSSHGLYFYSIGFPLGTVLLASVASAPIWLVAYVCALLFFSFWALAIHVEALALALGWIGTQATETAVHDAVADTVDEVTAKLKKLVNK
jgi:hypothetical protein